MLCGACRAGTKTNIGEVVKYNFDDEDRPRKFDPERKNRKTEDQDWRKEYEEYLEEIHEEFSETKENNNE
jgi:hypothetical protein